MHLIDLPKSLQRADLIRRLPTKPWFHDRTGEQMERCKVIGLVGFIGAKAAWLCECNCGAQYILRATDLNPSSAPRGCGCRRGERHGLHGTYIYRAWYNAIQRCYNPNHPKFHRYGARGIKMCDRWRNSPMAFARCMGARPTSRHSIDRKNNDGNYEPGNMRWATPYQQVHNRSCSKRKAS